MTKNQLKSLIKECLVEILSEGLGPAAAPIVEAAKKRSYSEVSQKSPTLSSVLQQTASRTRLGGVQNQAATKGREIRQQHQADASIREVIKREAGGNSVMADILTDTAMNSLPTMLESERTRNAPLPPAGTVERVVAAATPDQLFGEEAASKWAALAFMEPVKK